MYVYRFLQLIVLALLLLARPNQISSAWMRRWWPLRLPRLAAAAVCRLRARADRWQNRRRVYFQPVRWPVAGAPDWEFGAGDVLQRRFAEAAGIIDSEDWVKAFTWFGDLHNALGVSLQGGISAGELFRNSQLGIYVDGGWAHPARNG